MKERLHPQERIRKRKDFLFLYRKGHRQKEKYFNIIYLANNLAFSRMAVVASKKIGTAVRRNRIKRWIRELFRRNKDSFKDPLDIIIIVKKDVKEASWHSLKECYLAAVEVICKKRSP